MLGPPLRFARPHLMLIALLRLGCPSASLWLRSWPRQPFHGLRQFDGVGPFNNVADSRACERHPIGNGEQDIHQDHSQGQQFRHNGLLGETWLGCLQQSIARPLSDRLIARQASNSAYSSSVTLVLMDLVRGVGIRHFLVLTKEKASGRELTPNKINKFPYGNQRLL